MPVNIPRISGIDPKVAKLLEPMKLAIEELYGGGHRALRLTDLGVGFRQTPGGLIDFDPIVVPSVAPAIQRRIEALEAVSTDVSTLADELLGNARFGSLLGARVSDVKTLKVNVNGHIAGYGVAVYGGAEGPTTSDFVIQADRFSVVFPSPPWLPSHAYTLGQYVSATPESGVGNIIFEVTTAGTTGVTEPSWNTTPGQTTTSGSAVFTARTIDERVPFVVGNVGGVAGVGINGDLIVDGTISANHIEALSITTDKLAAGAVTAEKIATNLVLAHNIEVTTPGYVRAGQTAYDTGTGWFLGFVSSTPVFSIGTAGGNKVTWNGTTLSVVGNVSGALDANSITGTIPPSNFDISALGWTISSEFSSTDADTVAWTAGTLLTAAGTSYAIDAGDTGNMTERTYIFFDLNVSVTDLQITTTAEDAVGAGRILIAVAEDDSPDAFFQVFGGSGSFGVTSPDIPSYGPIANGDFETNTTVGWVSDASWAIVAETLVTGTYAARISTSSTGARSESFAAAPGDQFLVTCVAERDGGSTPDSALTLQIRWSDGTFSSSASANHSTSGVQFLRLVVTVPGGITSAQVALRKTGGSSGHWWADDVFVTPMIRNADIDLSAAGGLLNIDSQISGTLSTAFAEAGLINSNVTINANGTLSGAGGGQASLNSLPGTINLSSQVSSTLSTAFAAAGLINTNVTVNADGTLSGAGGGQVSLTSLPGTVAAGQIAANAVTTVKLAAAAVTAAKIEAGTITANEIAAATITGNRIAANTITGANIVALSITTAEIAAGAVTAAKIAAATITANEIAANTITSGQIASATITAGNIAASTITGSRIAAATILGTNIAAGTIQAVNIAAGTISANELAVNAVVANTIASGAVTASKLAATLIYGGEIIVDTNGLMRSGQTAFNTGTGWFLGNSGGTPVFSIGNPASTNLTWNGSVLNVVGNVRLTNAASTWGPTWDGFAVQPSGNLSYIDFGTYVMVFWGGSAALTGTSNSTSMRVLNLPAEIMPSGPRQVSCIVVDESIQYAGAAIVGPPVDPDAIFFFRELVLGSNVSVVGGFTGSGNKGLPAGWILTYPK